jgi:hypothetical protein
MFRKFILSVFSICIISLPVVLHAQIDTDPVPCSSGDTDPGDNYCPVDDYVMVLVVVTVFFTTTYMFRKRRVEFYTTQVDNVTLSD